MTRAMTAPLHRRELAITVLALAAATAGSSGAWGAPAATVALEATPRFYETLAFDVAALLASVLAAGGAVWLSMVGRRARQRDLQRLVEERTATIADQAEKLREIDRLKSQFFANVSHELRTPLTMTLGPLRDALDGRFGEIDPQLGAGLAVALRNAQRLLGLVDQLLDVARLDAGVRLRLRPRDLSGFVHSRVETFLPLAERLGVDLAWEGGGKPVEVYLDELQLDKVFDNLLANALKLTRQGGEVRVAIVEHTDGGVEVSVQDEGPGIPADKLDRIFERFFQVEPTTGRWPGIGIGLALARQIVELHHGTIAVRSEPGRGACFTVALRRGRAHLPADWIVDDGAPPARPAPSSATAAAILSERETPPPLPLGGEPPVDHTTVLVVEDNADIRRYIRRHLEPDYRVLEAADGAAGLERARATLPDLVVSDVMMPVLDGNELFRRLRADPELGNVPVVLLTAKAGPEQRLEGLREGVDDYLIKPFDPRELKARVDNLISARRRLRERLETPPLPPRSLQVTAVSVSLADDALLERVQAAIEERIDDPDLNVESLSRTLGCDRSYLLRKLRGLTGETPSEVIRSLRLQRSAQLLRHGAGTVSEVAYAVGFKSVAHFSNAFQARYHERPSAYAARHRQSRPAGKQD
jgi:signal transduction histidine kinase/DNA-binding response OmpR family regulator